MTEVKVQEGSNGQKLVTIPRDLARAMGFEKGVVAEWEIEDKNTLKIRPKE